MSTIEQATTADIPQLVDLLTLLFTQEADFQPDPTKQYRGLKLLLESPTTGRIFVAREQGELVGMVSLLFTISTAEGAQVCLLEDMIVREDHRGKGLGSQLLNHAITFAHSQGFSRITLLTDHTNNQAIHFYKQHGFTQSEMVALRIHL